MVIYFVPSTSDAPNIQSQITYNLKFHLHNFIYYENSVWDAVDMISEIMGENRKIHGLYTMNLCELYERTHLLAYAH